MASSSSRKYETRKRDPNPQIAALLVIDMQNHSPPWPNPSSTTLSPPSTSADASIPVFFTCHNHKAPTDHGMIGEWWNGDLILDGTTDSEIIPEIHRQVIGPDEVVEKSTYSAFHNTRLQEKLMNLAYGFAYLVDCDRLRRGLLSN